ncbi:MAG: transglutaminase domain-containing protein [Candidatus Saccharimonadaceae bacterium]
MSELTQKQREHYLAFSAFTNPGLYRDHLVALPDDIRELGLLVRQNFVHRTTLAWGNTKSNADMRFGDMTQMPWWRQPEDDNLTTAAAMLAELYRRDERGFVSDRHVKDKLVLTCRYDSILVASILKSKGIPARVRSGFAPYFEPKQSDDHWINQYWSDTEGRWITIDVDGSISYIGELDPYDMTDGQFDWSASAWLDVRSGTTDPEYYWNAADLRGLMPIAWELFYDFHCLMNNEIVYYHQPKIVCYDTFPTLNEEQLAKIDGLARLMLEPDENFDQLLDTWKTKKDFRLLSGGLL